MDKDRQILRELAKKVLEISQSEVNAERAEAWKKHNDLRMGSRTMIFCDPEKAWEELIPQQALQCEKAENRSLETALRREIYHYEILRDDYVVAAEMPVFYKYSCSDWGLHETVQSSSEDGAYTWESPLKDYSMLDRLKTPVVTVDEEGTKRELSRVQELFGDILQVRLRGYWWWSLGMTSTVIRLRGLEQFMLDMYDEPEGLHALMKIIQKGILENLAIYEEKNLLTTNADHTYVGSGGFGFTDGLSRAEPVRMKNMWGFSESQETSSVSAEMYGEFVFPYEMEILEKFGLNCYGCCEPLENKWEYIRRFPRLRRVSVSPWANRQKMAEQLGSGYVYSLKPNPAYISVRSELFDDAARELAAAREATKKNGCFTEIIMKDLRTFCGAPGNAARWVRLARSIFPD